MEVIVMKELSDIVLKIRNEDYSSGKFLHDISKNSDYKKLSRDLQIKFQDKVLDVLSEISATRDSRELDQTSKNHIIENIVSDIDTRLSSTMDDINTELTLKNLNNHPLYASIFDHPLEKITREQQDWLFEDEILELAKSVDKNINLSISNSKFINSELVEDMYKLNFIKPLQQFQNDISNSVKNAEKDKFSTIINVGDHWTSLTVVPSQNNSSKAHAIYRDSFGSPPPPSIVEGLKEVYPNIEIAYSGEKLQYDMNSCSIFAVMSSVGDNQVSNNKIQNYFEQAKNEQSLNKLTERLDKRIKLTLNRNKEIMEKFVDKALNSNLSLEAKDIVLNASTYKDVWESSLRSREKLVLQNLFVNSANEVNRSKPTERASHNSNFSSNDKKTKSSKNDLKRDF
jgi:hypothetical protein